MRVEIAPEPSPKERKALLTGLERLLSEADKARRPAAYASAWRRAGLQDSLGLDEWGGPASEEALRML